MMLEKQRLTYLSHLGIENYMPRKALAGAAPSILLPDEYLAQVTVISESAAEDNTIENKTPPLSIQSILEASESKTPEPKETDSQSKPEQAQEENADARVSNIRFVLNAWRIEPNVLVVDSREQGAALPTDRLLQNMLRSVGYSLAQLPASETIRWPLFNEQQSQESEARAMVQAYISAYCEQNDARAILLMGKEAVQFSLDVDEDAAAFYEKHCGSILMQPQWSVNVAIIPSLADMLHEPLQKRLAWQALQKI